MARGSDQEVWKTSRVDESRWVRGGGGCSKISPVESGRDGEFFLIITGWVGSGRVGSGRVGSGRVGSGRVGSGRVGSGRVGPGRPDPIRPGKSDLTGEKSPANNQIIPGYCPTQTALLGNPYCNYYKSGSEYMPPKYATSPSSKANTPEDQRPNGQGGPQLDQARREAAFPMAGGFVSG